MRDKLSLHNLAGLLRWAILRATYPGRVRGLYFLSRRPTIKIGRDGRLEVGRGTIVSKDFTARIDAPVRLGEGVFFDPGCHLVVTEGVEIGREALIWEYVTIDDSPRAGGVPTGPSGSRQIRIGDCVSIGPMATILSGVTIGDYCIIGAHAVVESDLPSGSIAFGSPARAVRQLAVPTRAPV